MLRAPLQCKQDSSLRELDSVAKALQAALSITVGLLLRRNLQVGPGSEEFIHTVTGGQLNDGSPAFVAVSAGCFFSRAEHLLAFWTAHARKALCFQSAWHASVLSYIPPSLCSLPACQCCNRSDSAVASRLQIPGYAGGCSFMFKLFDGLSAGFRLYAIDPLGTGLSGAAHVWL